MWLQRWLGKIYARGWSELRTGPFTADGLAGVAGIELNKARVALSLLKRAGAAIGFAKEGRKTVYRFVDPRAYLLLEAGILKNVRRVPPRYFHLIVGAASELSFMKGVLGFAVYGSVARGDFKPTSDVDALVVSRDLPRSLAKRVDAFLGVEELLRGEISFLADRGVYTHLSWTPLTPEELARVPPVLLDIAEDGLVVFEKGGFLTKILALIRGKLVELGASRFEVCGKGYWDLGAKWGELAIELPEAG